MNTPPNQSTSREEKFFKFAVPRDDGCWEWIGQINKKGYALIREQRNYKRRWILAHRVSWEIFKGRIPVGKYVLHQCDNPICTNPGHLFIGTLSDNSKDAFRKGRTRLPSVKLTRENRIWAHKMRFRMNRKQIATLLEVSRQTVDRLFNGKCWQHVGLKTLP